MIKKQIASKLLAERQKLKNFHILAGFDGFEDKIQRVVESELKGDLKFFPSISAYAEAIAKAAGKSSQYQLSTQIHKLGGNAPIMAHALGNLGIKCTLAASLGYPEIRPVFRELHPDVETISFCNPSETNALEFDDGKLILSEMSSFRSLNWDFVKTHPSYNLLKTSVESAELVALVDWANLIHGTDLWKGFLKDILSSIGKKKKIFFDIADPSRKTKDDIVEILNIISDYRSCGEVVLGINENETIRLFHMLTGKDKMNDDLEQTGHELFGLLKVDALLIHPTRYSMLITSEGILREEGHFIPNPRISTGGGDNFNSGFCLGWLMSYPSSECLHLAMANSGAYVKYGMSPDLEGLCNFLNE